MKVMLVPSSVAGPDAGADQFLTSYLIDETLAIDAGSIGFYGTADEQARIKHVLISHSHLDHIASLPILVENAYEGRRDCITIHGSREVLDCLRADVFNDRLWPDFERLSPPGAPLLKFQELEPLRTIELEGHRITPVPVDHLVPTLGFIIENRDAAIAIISDTGPTEVIWRRANATPFLKAVFLEAAFPNAMVDLATASRHICPDQFAREVAKLDRPTTIIAVHIKSRFRAEIIRELEALGLPDLQIGQFGRAYHF